MLSVPPTRRRFIDVSGLLGHPQFRTDLDDLPFVVEQRHITLVVVEFTTVVCTGTWDGLAVFGRAGSEIGACE